MVYELNSTIGPLIFAACTFFFPLWFEDVSSSTLHFSFMDFVLHEEKRGKKKEDTQALGLTCDMLWTKLLKKICGFLEWLYGICGGL